MNKKCIYYLKNGELCEKEVTSYHSGLNELEVILTIAFDGEKIIVNHKARSAKNFEKQAILMFNGMWEYDEKASAPISEKLIAKISEHVQRSIQNITRKYQAFASEDMITSAFGDRLFESFKDNNLNIDVRFQSYSSVKKEPVNGADLSFIFDIKDRNGQRVIKSILMQAKKVSNSKKCSHNLPRLTEQIEKMSKITTENYVLLYSPDGFNAYQSSNLDSPLSVDSLFSAILRCRSGDKSKNVLASSLDSKHLMILDVDESSNK